MKNQGSEADSRWPNLHQRAWPVFADLNTQLTRLKYGTGYLVQDHSRLRLSDSGRA